MRTLIALLLTTTAAYAQEPIKAIPRSISGWTDGYLSRAVGKLVLENVSGKDLFIVLVANGSTTVGNCTNSPVNTDQVSGVSVGIDFSATSGYFPPGPDLQHALQAFPAGSKIAVTITVHPCTVLPKGAPTGDITLPLFIADGNGKGSRYSVTAFDVPIQRPTQ